LRFKGRPQQPVVKTAVPDQDVHQADGDDGEHRPAGSRSGHQANAGQDRGGRAAGPFTGLPGGAVAAVLAGIGLMSGAASVGAVLSICTIGLVNALVWYGRLHYRLLKPALEPQSVGGVR
jgi:hypothetical protein